MTTDVSKLKAARENLMCVDELAELYSGELLPVFLDLENGTFAIKESEGFEFICWAITKDDVDDALYYKIAANSI